MTSEAELSNNSAVNWDSEDNLVSSGKPSTRTGFHPGASSQTPSGGLGSDHQLWTPACDRCSGLLVLMEVMDLQHCPRRKMVTWTAVQTPQPRGGWLWAWYIQEVTAARLPHRPRANVHHRNQIKPKTNALGRSIKVHSVGALNILTAYQLIETHITNRTFHYFRFPH